MTAGPPQDYPPPPPPSAMPPPPPQYGTQPTQPQRRGFFNFRGMQWWEIGLVVLPLSLIFLGGLIGGVFGALAAIGNNYVARSGMSAAVRALVMIGLLIAAYVLWLIVGIAILAAVHSATG